MSLNDVAAAHGRGKDSRLDQAGAVLELVKLTLLASAGSLSLGCIVQSQANANVCSDKYVILQPQRDLSSSLSFSFLSYLFGAYQALCCWPFMLLATARHPSATAF